MEKEITSKELKACADEMNQIMGLEPKIKLVAVKADDLKQAIIVNACGIREDGSVVPEDGIQETDTFSIDTWRTLTTVLDPENENQAATHAIASEHVESYVEANVKAAEKPKKEKPPKEKKERQPRATKPLSERKSQNAKLLLALAEMVEQGTMSRKDVVAGLKEKFPDANPSTINTMVTDSCNPKYNKLDKLVVKTGENQVLSFAE